MATTEAVRRTLRRGLGVFGFVGVFIILLLATTRQGFAQEYVYSGLIGESVEVEDMNSTAIILIQDFAMKWVKHHVSMPGRDVVLNKTLPIQEQKLFYSQTGTAPMMFQYQKRNEFGMMELAETALKLGTNHHVTLFVDWQEEGSQSLDQSEHSAKPIGSPVIHQTHRLVVLKDIDQILAITSHTWQEGHVEATPKESEAPEASEEYVAQADGEGGYTVHPKGKEPKGHDHEEFVSAIDAKKPATTTTTATTSTTTTETLNNDNNDNTDASTNGTVKLVSFNIWNLNHPWPTRLLMLEEQVVREDPEIIGWQEVRYDWSKFRRTHFYENEDPEAFHIESSQGNSGRLQVEQLAHLKGFENYQFVFAPAMTYLNLHSRTDFHSDEGLAIFSKYPILNTTVKVLSRDLHDRQDEHQRICLRALIDLPGRGRINFFVTHLTLSDEARDRTVAEIWDFVEQITEDMGPDANVPNVLTGDFNTLPDTSSLEFLTGRKEISGKKGGFRDAWVLHQKKKHQQQLQQQQQPLLSYTPDPGYSFPTWKPEKRIDFFLINGGIDVQDIYLIGNTTLPAGVTEQALTSLVSSDHLGLATTLYFTRKSNNKE